MAKVKEPASIDWLRVLADLERAGYSHPCVAKLIDVPLNTLRGWKYGSEPRHYSGEYLLDLWCAKLGNNKREAPRVSCVIGSADNQVFEPVRLGCNRLTGMRGPFEAGRVVTDCGPNSHNQAVFTSKIE